LSVKKSTEKGELFMANEKNKWSEADGLKRSGQTAHKYASGGASPPALEAFNWADALERHGLEAALKIGGGYLNARLKSPDKSERQFCRELFRAMAEARGFTERFAAYPYSLPEARERGELDLYRANRERDQACAEALDAAISGSWYEPSHYNLPGAALAAVNEYGFERVSHVLAANIAANDWDRRYSGANKEWAGEFAPPERTAFLSAHPVLLDGFANELRKLQAEMGEILIQQHDAPEQSPERGMTMGGM
jgi:hypothetical protein